MTRTLRTAAPLSLVQALLIGLDPAVAASARTGARTVSEAATARKRRGGRARRPATGPVDALRHHRTRRWAAPSLAGIPDGSGRARPVPGRGRAVRHAPVPPELAAGRVAARSAGAARRPRRPPRADEHDNVGGKTKWYGAALLRFLAHECAADPTITAWLGRSASRSSSHYALDVVGTPFGASPRRRSFLVRSTEHKSVLRKCKFLPSQAVTYTRAAPVLPRGIGR
jgi:hypothetical protein